MSLPEFTQTETLKLGDKAPDFSLRAANSEEIVTLKGLLARGPAIVEFLRGTW